MVEMPNFSHLHAAFAKGGVLKSLALAGGFTVREPDRGSIGEKGSDKGFESDYEGLFLLAPVGASKSTEDVEAGD